MAATATPTPNVESLRAQAVEYLSNDRFHRRFTLPATSEHEALTVSYSDVGRAPDQSSDDDADLPTILFMPGMFASRYLGISFHPIAKKLNVRVLVVDRFGMGSTTDVPLKQRISIWVELVPLLLAHLGIKHVVLGSHSAGTLYLLNTLAHHRHILHPEHPLIVFLTPWVDCSISRVTTMQMAQYIPNKAFGIWNMIPKFFLVDAGPVFASSGTVITKFSNMLHSLTSDGAVVESEQEKNIKRMDQVYGIPRDLQPEIEKVMFHNMFEESTVGANSEALQCLRKGDDWTWGSCDDYAEYVKKLLQQEKESAAQNSTEGRKKLRVRVFFAETDAMIGPKGQSYFEECWRGAEGTPAPDAIDLDMQTIKGVDHDSLVHSVEMIESIFIQAGGLLDIAGVRGSTEVQQ